MDPTAVYAICVVGGAVFLSVWVVILVCVDRRAYRAGFSAARSVFQGRPALQLSYLQGYHEGYSHAVEDGGDKGRPHQYLAGGAREGRAREGGVSENPFLAEAIRGNLGNPGNPFAGKASGEDVAGYRASRYPPLSGEKEYPFYLPLRDPIPPEFERFVARDGGLAGAQPHASCYPSLSEGGAANGRAAGSANVAGGAGAVDGRTAGAADGRTAGAADGRAIEF